MAKQHSFFKRYFDSNYSRSDYNSVLKGFEAKNADGEFAESLNEHWMNYEDPKDSSVNLNPVLLKLHRQIIQGKNEMKPIKLFNTIQRIAAILFVPLLIASSVFFFQDRIEKNTKSSWAEIKCPLGVRTQFELPDGSTGFLNSGSSLKFPSSFNGKDRSVQLLGEAYFDVIHNNKQPFHVKTGRLDVKVLGTSFNVVAYPDQQFEEITLESGSVDILSKIGERLTVLKPDEQLSLNLETNKYSKSEVTASQYISWTAGILSFRNERFEQVARRMSRWYNVDIDLEGEELNGYIYHATFENEPLEEVLKLMALTAPITFKITNRKLLKDGSFTDRVVSIKYDSNKLIEFK